MPDRIYEKIMIQEAELSGPNEGLRTRLLQTSNNNWKKHGGKENTNRCVLLINRQY